MEQISSIEFFPLSIPLKVPFVTSLGATDRVESVVVRMTTRDGLVGWGECNPYGPINGETQATCMAVGKDLAQVLLGCDPADMEEVHTLMDRAIHGNNSIKSALDIACHDIAALAGDRPLYEYLGASIPRPLITDYTVVLGTKEQMAAEALDIMRRGFTVVKVKVGRDPDEDIARIAAIREAIGPDVPLRLDANQGWSPEQAIHVLGAVADANIQHCEEPIARWRFLELRRVKEASPIPIMADESCFDHHDAERLIELGACQRFNIKLGKSGGLFKAGKIIALAEAAGMEVQIGGFLESRLGWTAAAHLALTSDAVRYCDMDTPLMFTADPVVGGIVYGEGGSITVPVRSGLGASIAAEHLGTAAPAA